MVSNGGRTVVYIDVNADRQFCMNHSLFSSFEDYDSWTVSREGVTVEFGESWLHETEKQDWMWAHVNWGVLDLELDPSF